MWLVWAERQIRNVSSQAALLLNMDSPGWHCGRMCSCIRLVCFFHHSESIMWEPGLSAVTERLLIHGHYVNPSPRSSMIMM